VTGATVAVPGVRSTRFVDEIIIDTGWRSRIRSLTARRRDSWTVMAIVVAAVCIGLLVWGRPSAARIAPPAEVPGSGSVASAAASPTPTVFVHVAGAVRRPGLYEFPLGARVADAIETAGGALRAADIDALNLAALLVDGSKVEVTRFGEPPVSSDPSTPSPAAVSLNSADQTALESVPGIGPVTALAIIAERDQLGGFRSIEQLLEVDGIGPSTLESIRPYFTL
jgi:competence protein ComEA